MMHFLEFDKSNGLYFSKTCSSGDSNENGAFSECILASCLAIFDIKGVFGFGDALKSVTDTFIQCVSYP